MVVEEEKNRYLHKMRIYTGAKAGYTGLEGSHQSLAVIEVRLSLMYQIQKYSVFLTNQHKILNWICDCLCDYTWQSVNVRNMIMITVFSAETETCSRGLPGTKEVADDTFYRNWVLKSESSAMISECDWPQRDFKNRILAQIQIRWSLQRMVTWTLVNFWVLPITPQKP